MSDTENGASILAGEVAGCPVRYGIRDGIASQIKYTLENEEDGHKVLTIYNPDTPAGGLRLSPAWCKQLAELLTEPAT